MQKYDFTVETSMGFAETVALIEAKTAEKGFRVLYTHDVQATLAGKGFPIEPMKIVEICNAKFASQILAKDKIISIMLPCPISVYTDGGKTLISTMLPSSIGALFPDRDVDEVTANVEKIVIEIIEETASTPVK